MSLIFLSVLPIRLFLSMLTKKTTLEDRSSVGIQKQWGHVSTITSIKIAFAFGKSYNHQELVS